MNASTAKTIATNRHLFKGAFAILILLFGFGTWLAFARLGSAVIAPSYVDYLKPRTAIQHDTGGRIAEVYVADGQAVSAGDVLLRFETDELSQRLRETELKLAELQARSDQAQAELQGKPVVEFETMDHLKFLQPRDISRIQKTHQDLHRERLALADVELKNLLNRQDQVRTRIGGLKAQLKSTEEQLETLSQQSKQKERLRAQGLVADDEILALKTSRARLQGQLGKLTAEIAESRIRLTESDLAVTQTRVTAKEAALTTQRDVEFRLAEVRQEHATLGRELNDLTVRTPIDGVVSADTALAAGQIANPSQHLMTILPNADALVFRVALPVDKRVLIHIGQPVHLKMRLPGHPLPEKLSGLVSAISPEALSRNAGELPTYAVAVRPVARSQVLHSLSAGMPAEVFFETGTRPAWHYLAGPFSNFFSRALRES